MTDQTHLPAISRQVTELVLSGSTKQAEAAFNEAAEKMGDLAVVEVLEKLEPHVASLHMSAFDGGKMSLATLLIPPKAWADSLAFFAAKWDEDMIADKTEELAESLFTHIHGVIYSTDDPERRAALIHAALSTDWGTTAFAVMFSTAIGEIVEIANSIHSRGAASSGQTESDHDVIPLALEIARTDIDAWERVIFEIFPEWQPDSNQLVAESDNDSDDEEEDGAEEATSSRSTKELMLRLRKQVPTQSSRAPTKKRRRPDRKSTRLNSSHQ